MNLTKREFNAILRQDFVSFVQKVFATLNAGEPYLHNWHIEAICYHLQCCHEGQFKRSIITVPPRHLKSIIASVAYPAWVLGHDPSRQIICASYSQSLANKHARDTRIIIESAWYKACFPNSRIHKSKNSEAEFVTTKQGGRLATSVGGTLTGRGGNLLIIDDSLKADDATSDTALNNANEWFGNTVSSRLNNKVTDPIIVIQQRLHENDLVGFLLDTGEWKHLNLPAIAEEHETIRIAKHALHERLIGDVLHPARESKETLDELQRSLGSYNFAAQYQQRPAPLGGGIVKWEWFKSYEKVPDKEAGDLIVQSWDTASKAEEFHDWSVGTTWMIKNQKCYLLHVERRRLEYPKLKAHIIRYAKRWEADQILIEDKGAGTSLIQDLRNSCSYNITKFEPKGDKQTRMMEATTIIESEKVLIPKEASWLADFQHEVVSFPKGKHDDQVDSMSQFLIWAKNKTQYTGPLIPIIAYSPWLREWDEMHALNGHYYP